MAEFSELIKPPPAISYSKEADPTGIKQAITNVYYRIKPKKKKSKPSAPIPEATPSQPEEQPTAAYYKGDVYTSTGKVYGAANPKSLPQGFQPGEIQKISTVYKLEDVGTGKVTTGEFSNFYIAKRSNEIINKSIPLKSKVSKTMSYEDLFLSSSDEKKNKIERFGERLQKESLGFAAWTIGGSRYLQATSTLQYQQEQLNKDINKFNAKIAIYNVLYGDKELKEDVFKKAEIEKVGLESESQRLSLKQFNLEKFKSEIDKELESPIKAKAIPSEALYGFASLGAGAVTLVGKSGRILTMPKEKLKKDIYKSLDVKKTLKTISKIDFIKLRGLATKEIRRNLPMTIISVGIAKGLYAGERFLLAPSKAELLAVPKTTTASLTKLTSIQKEVGTLTKARVGISTLTEPQVVRVTSRMDRMLQNIENLRAKTLNIKPKQYGDIIEGKFKSGGSLSRNIFYLNQKQINPVIFYSKNKGQSLNVNLLRGGMSQEIRANLIDISTKDIKELTESLAEARYGVPNIKTFKKNKIINLGYQESKELFKVLRTNERVYPQTGKTITRTNIAGIIEKFPFKLKLPKDIKLYTETFVGKDVTYPFKKTPPFQIKGLIVEKEIPTENVVMSITGGNKKSGSEYFKSLYDTKQIKMDLQSKKAQMVNKIIQKQTKNFPSQLLSKLQKQYVQPERSLYYGLGLYERTDEMLSHKEIQRQFNNLFSLQTTNIKQTPLIRQTPINIFSTIPLQIPKHSTKLSEINKQVPREIQKEQFKLMEKQVNKLIQKPIQKLTPAFKVPQRFVQTKTAYFAFTKPREFKINNLGKESGYSIFLKRGKKEFKMPGVFGKGEAKRLLEARLLSSLTARGGIRKTSILVTPKYKSYELSGKIFRSYRIKNRQPIPLKEEWIQRRSKRLITPMEKAEILLARRKKK